MFGSRILWLSKSWGPEEAIGVKLMQRLSRYLLNKERQQGRSLSLTSKRKPQSDVIATESMSF